MLAQSVGSRRPSHLLFRAMSVVERAAVVVVSRWAACTRQQNGTAQARGFQLFAHPGAWYRFSCCLSSPKDPGQVLRRAIRIDRSDHVVDDGIASSTAADNNPTGYGQTAGAVGKFDGRAGILTLSSSARACGHQTESGLAWACSLPMGGTREGLAWSIAIPSTGID